MAKRKQPTARDIKPSADIQREYRRKLMALIDEMSNSILYWLTAKYRQYETDIVSDANRPDVALNQEIERLSAQWLSNFTEVSENIAKWFATQNLNYSRARIRKSLRDVGFSIKFRNTRRTQSIIGAAVKENVSLIKSIPEQFLRDVEGIVQRGVMEGRNLAGIKKELAARYPITERRARLISIDQTNKLTSVITKSEYQEHGLTRAIWRHNPGGSKTYRPEHVGWDGKEFDISQGMYSDVDGEYVWPGTQIACKCTYRPIVHASKDITPLAVSDSFYFRGF